MKTRTMTCVTCPVGCEMTVEYKNKKLISVSGATCRRGEKYAADEIENPRRTVTSTIPVDGGLVKLLPVKTDKPIPKDKITEAMKIINKQRASIPVKVGDIICADFIEGGINLVACRTVELGIGKSFCHFGEDEESF